MKIIVAPNPVLSQKAKPVKKIDKETLMFIESMKEALLLAKDPVGVGLAAPQVGKSLRIFVAKPREKIMVFINPVIVKSSKKSVVPNLSNSPKIESKKPKGSRRKLLEGCLSIPNIWGNVARKTEITVRYQDPQGEQITKTFKGFSAVIVQHEIDHLNGVLFTKRLLERKGKLYQSHKNEKGEDEFEEIEV